MRVCAIAILLFFAAPACGDDAPSSSGPAAGEHRREPEHPPREVDVPGGPEPMPLAVGQWVRYRVSWREGGASEMTYRIVSEEDNAYWLEIDDERRGGSNVTRLLVEVRDRDSVDGMSVRKMTQKTPQDDRPIPFPSRAMSEARPLFEPFLRLLVTQGSTSSQEDVIVVAGRFRSAYRTERDLAFGGNDLPVALWHHPEVPITGLVRMMGLGENRHSLELIAYGRTGAIPAY